ncbi:hypothetical protein Nepgr_004628 [Nepenthes gracilis]|uniref:GATA transcription factor n=1 Tax=Nepenthes gracilis TaxID=150966 RepID=A0AAD3XFC9_NEPGR|nr:hypothetical protein Nepgr_004628 [Nepenthes gracilis]
MECIEARALKSSFFSKIAMKSSKPQIFSDEFWNLTGINGVLPCDDFSVDDFFDLPSEDSKDECFLEEENEEEEEEKDSSSLSLSSQDQIDDGHSNSSGLSGTAVSGSLSGDVLSAPVDDLAELELWSHFMDDSVSEFYLACPIGNGHAKTGLHAENRSVPEPPPALRSSHCIPADFPVKRRSKRNRVNRPQAWSFVSTSKTESSSSRSSPAAFGPFLTNPVHDVDPFNGLTKPELKKQKKNQAAAGGLCTQRRCTHCLVQKTPQWRTGPLGPKTLCNACGVRFKKGRLFPEYRPACSPTFSGEIHSNSHRKVLEIRRKKT